VNAQDSIPRDEVWEALLDAIAASITLPDGISLADLTPETTLDDLGLTSLDVVNVVFELEERFDCNFLDAVPERAGTLGATYRLLEGVLVAKRANA
jgi:acyl carrier protein